MLFSERLHLKGIKQDTQHTPLVSMYVGIKACTDMHTHILHMHCIIIINNKNKSKRCDSSSLKNLNSCFFVLKDLSLCFARMCLKYHMHEVPKEGMGFSGKKLISD